MTDTLTPATAEAPAAIPPFADAPPAPSPHFSVDGKSLAAALSLLGDVVPRRTTLPVLQGVRLESSARGVTATATDLNLWATVSVSGAERGKADGAVLLPAQPLRQLLRTQKGPLVFMGTRVGADNVSVKFAGVGGDGEGLPDAPVFGVDVDDFAIPYAVLRDVSERVAFAASGDPSRPNLQHVAFEREGERVHCVATNGHRLALLKVEVPEGMPAHFSARLRPKALRVAVRLFKGQESVLCRFSGQYVEFSGAGRVLVARLGEDPYPNYKQVIPEKPPRTAKLNRPTLATAVRTAMVVAPSQTHRLAFVFSGDVLAVEASDLITGEVRSLVPVEMSDSEPFTIGFNALYLLDALSRTGGDEVTLGLYTPQSAVTLAAGDDDALTQLLMPLRLL